MHQHPVLETHADSSGENDVDLESANQQGAHGPLMPVVRVVGVGPRREPCPKQPANVSTEGELIRSIEADPKAVAVVGGFVAAQN